MSRKDIRLSQVIDVLVYHVSSPILDLFILF